MAVEFAMSSPSVDLLFDDSAEGDAQRIFCLILVDQLLYSPRPLDGVLYTANGITCCCIGRLMAMLWRGFWLFAEMGLEGVWLGVGYSGN
jgi:hypothetical protein